MAVNFQLRLPTIMQEVALNTIRFNRNLSIVQNQITRFSRAMSDIGISMSLAVSIPLQVLGGLSTKIFSELEDASIRASTVFDNFTKETSKEITAWAQLISSRVPMAVEDIIKGVEELGKVGFNLKASMSVVEDMARFSVVGGMKVEDSISKATGVFLGFGLATGKLREDQKRLRRVINLIAKAADMSKASFEGMTEAFKTATPIAKAFGISIEETAAVLAAYAQAGIEGSDAGTKFRQMLLDLTNTASKNREAWERLAGTNAIFDSSGQLQNLATMAENVRKSLSRYTPEARAAALATLEIPRRSFQATAALFGLSGSIREFEKELHRTGDYIGTRFTPIVDSLKSQATMLWNQVQSVGYSIGEILVPYLQKGIQYVQAMVERWHALTESQRQSVVHWGLFVMALGPALILLGQAANFLNLLGGATWIVLGAMAQLTTRLHQDAQRLNLYAGSANLARTAMQGLGSGASLLYSAFVRSGDAFEIFTRGLGSIGSGALSMFRSNLTGIRQTLSMMGTILRSQTIQFGFFTAAVNAAKLALLQLNNAATLNQLRNMTIDLGRRILGLRLSSLGLGAAFAMAAPRTSFLIRQLGFLRGSLVAARMAANRLNLALLPITGSVGLVIAVLAAGAYSWNWVIEATTGVNVFAMAWDAVRKAVTWCWDKLSAFGTWLFPSLRGWTDNLAHFYDNSPIGHARQALQNAPGAIGGLLGQGADAGMEGLAAMQQEMDDQILLTKEQREELASWDARAGRDMGPSKETIEAEKAKLREKWKKEKEAQEKEIEDFRISLMDEGGDLAAKREKLHSLAARKLIDRMEAAMIEKQLDMEAISGLQASDPTTQGDEDFEPEEKEEKEKHVSEASARNYSARTYGSAEEYRERVAGQQALVKSTDKMLLEAKKTSKNTEKTVANTQAIKDAVDKLVPETAKEAALV